MARDVPDSGLFTDRVEFVRETTQGTIETDPAYQFFSDNPKNVSYSPGVANNRRDGLGTPDAVSHDSGDQQASIEIMYDLQKQVVDTNGDPDGASGDAWLRGSDGLIKNTHQIRARDNRTVNADDDPAAADGARKYLIGLGGIPNCDLELDPADGRPVEATMTYNCEKVRQYEVFQPPGDEALDVVSTDTGDTSQTLSIEDDTGTSEDVALNGTTAVTTTKTDWASIRGAELDAETAGDVSISLSTSGDDLFTIRGAAYYSQGNDTAEGDLGVPIVGGGSLATAIGTAYEYVEDTTVTRGGSSLNFDLNRMGLSVDNDFEAQARIEAAGSRWDEGNRDASLETDLIGWGADHDYHEEALGVVEDDVVLTTSSTQWTLKNAVPTEAPPAERAGDDTAVVTSVTFEPSSDGGVEVAQAP